MMKQLTILFILFWVMVGSSNVFAQSPQSFSYQAVVRNNGSLIANSVVTVEASLRRGSGNGPYTYREDHSTTTDEYGMFNIEVGEGTPSQGTFAGVDWTNGPYYLEIRASFGGNTINFGASKLQSVPYALHSPNPSQWSDNSSGINYQSNVGIGAGSPQDRLHVTGGGVRVDQTTGSPTPSTMYGNSLPLAYGYADGGTMLTNYGIQSFSNPSDGEFAIVLSNNFSGAPVVISTSFNSSPKNELITYSYQAPNIILLHINQDSGPEDSNFSFVVFGTAQ